MDCKAVTQRTLNITSNQVDSGTDYRFTVCQRDWMLSTSGDFPVTLSERVRLGQPFLLEHLMPQRQNTLPQNGVDLDFQELGEDL